MGHLLATVNPEAAAAADDGWQPAGAPLADPLAADHEEMNGGINPIALGVTPTRQPIAIPGIGNSVVYHLRDGDSRNMRTKFPAIVMDGDPYAGTLKLWVIVDDGDTWMQDHVPPHAAPEPGWELVNDGPNLLSLEVARLGDRVANLEHTIKEDGEAFADLLARVESLEEARRKPGRPSKSKG